MCGQNIKTGTLPVYHLCCATLPSAARVAAALLAAGHHGACFVRRLQNYRAQENQLWIQLLKAYIRIAHFVERHILGAWKIKKTTFIFLQILQRISFVFLGEPTLFRPLAPPKLPHGQGSPTYPVWVYIHGGDYSLGGAWDQQLDGGSTVDDLG